MIEEEKKQAVIGYWLNKADEALESARMELDAGRFSFAINRIYYACFYSVSALLLKSNAQFKKHSGVRAAFHRDYIKPGLMSIDFGKFYDLIYYKREQGDYRELVNFEREEVEEHLMKAGEFAEFIKGMIRANG